MAVDGARFRWWWLLVAAALVLAAWLAWSAWRGPLLPGYVVAEGPLVQSVVATGRVAAPSRVQVGAEVTGLVLERRVMEGDRVAPGDVLLVLSAAELEARRDEARAALDALRTAERADAEARLRQVRAELAQAEREHARRRELGERGVIAREAVEQAAQAVVTARAAAEQARVAAEALSAGGAREAQLLERLAAAEADLSKAVLRATVSGQVITRAVEPGEVARPGDVLLEIARDAPGEILLPLDEKNLARVAHGQHATVIADAFPQQAFAATVHHIAPGIDPSRGTVDVRLRIVGEQAFLRQGMTVTVSIVTGQREHALVVPNDALREDSDGRRGTSVLAVREHRVQRTPVTLGLRGLATSEITSGLRAGDHVLAAGASEPGAVPADGERVRVDVRAAPAANDSATRGELPVQFN